MKKLQCDFCYAEVNNYGHWYNGEKPRSMYVLKCVDEFNSDAYDGMIICHKCITKMFSYIKKESEV